MNFKLSCDLEKVEQIWKCFLDNYAKDRCIRLQVTELEAALLRHLISELEDALYVGDEDNDED